MVTGDPEVEEEANTKTSKVDAVEKIDSGMEEDSNPGNMMQGDGSDNEDDDAVVVKKQSSKSKQRLILDDDSDMSDTEIKQPKEKTFTTEQALEAVLADSSDNSEGEEEMANTTASAKKWKIKRPVTDDSSSDEENVVDKKTSVSKEELDDQKKDEDKSTETALENSVDEDVLSAAKKPDDDANNSDSDSSENRSSSGSDSEKSDGEHPVNDDEGFNEDTLDPKLLAKLKKGAGKKPRDKSARISKKEEMMSIHSESQRIVREGRVNLPYHQPAPKSLNDFLARATKKRQEYHNIRGGVRDTRKAKAIEGLLQSSRLQVKQKTQEELDKYSDSDEDWDVSKEKEKSLRERVTDRLKDIGKSADKSVDKSEDKSVDKSEDNLAENTETKSIDEIEEKLAEKIEYELETKDSAENVESMITDSAIDENKDSVVTGNDTDDDDLPDLVVEKEQAKSEAKHDSEVIDCNELFEKDTRDKIMLDANESNEQENNPNDVLYEWEKTETSKKDSEADTDKLQIDNDSSADKENKCDSDMLNSSEKEKKPENNPSPSRKTDKKLRKERLLALAGIDLNMIKPCLSGETETFITLEEKDDGPQNPGVVKLMDRLTKHAVKKEKKHSKDLDISIISKDKVGMDKEELKLNTITYHIEEEDTNPLLKLETPGAKLLALKEQLQEKIKEKREAARQKRQELYNLDNEEGDFGADEEEMSEHSDTDVDDDEFENQFGGEVDEEDEEKLFDEEEEMIEEKQRERNPFADDQADEDGEEEEEELEDGDEENDDDGAEADDEDEMNLKLDVSDEEEDTEEVVSSKDKNKKTKEKLCNEDGEDDDTSDAKEFKEPSPKKLPEKPFSLFGQRSRDNSFTDTQIQSGQKPSSLRLQIEDSQDLYGTLPQLASTQDPSMTQSGSPPQSFNFLLEDSQSVMLDADGYFKTKSTGKKKPSAVSALEDLSNTQDGMGDILGLCSGKFVSQAGGKDKPSKKSLFDDSSASNTQHHMEEFMGLCSGVFADSKEGQSQKQGTKRKVSSDDENDSIEALSDNEDREVEKDEHSEVDEERDTDHLEEEGEEEKEEEEKPQRFTGFLAKKGKIRKEFVEEEAELSGSEFDSDENLDIPEEEDIMELEEADKEMANVDQEELRDEVGRVHFKQMIDEDKRELLRFQEMYLADGDLHSEGGGRVRRFKWSNMDDDTQQDMFGDGSDGEGVEHEDPEESHWRKERHEREKFLKEQQEKETNDGENSQFLKFGKVFLKKQVSVDASKDKKESQPAGTLTGNQADTPGFPGSFVKLSKQKRGSFLARSKEALAKIAEMTKPVANPSAGAKSSGKFTFQVISPTKEKEGAPSPAGKQRKAHVPVQKPKSNFKKPPMKKQKLDTASGSQNKANKADPDQTAPVRAGRSGSSMFAKTKMEKLTSCIFGGLRTYCRFRNMKLLNKRFYVKTSMYQWEPPDLKTEPDIPEYKDLNIKLFCYDFPVVESFENYVLKAAKEFGIDSNSWEVPPYKWAINTLKFKKPNVIDTYELLEYIRVVQMQDVPSVKLPLFIELLKCNCPAGLRMEFAKHTEEDEEYLLIPDYEKHKYEKELEELDERRKWL